MEKRKEALSSFKVCRFCLSQDEPLKSLHEKDKPSKDPIPMSLKILSNVSIEVFPSDKMPSFICKRCSFYMDLFFDFKKICRDADESILQYVQDGMVLEPTVWPPTLVKLFRYGSRSTQPVNITVEGGATVEVTSQELSDSEEEDGENVYNVKIGDGTEEGSSACVKVVTSNDDSANITGKGKSKKDLELTLEALDGDETATNLTDGCWPCNECHCTYPLLQLLELHKQQKHRERNVPCNQCEAKFYSKYDLATHQLRHSAVMAYSCPACDQSFRRLQQLKRHEREVHSDIPQKKCPYCPASFLTLEEWKAHQYRHLHGSKSEKREFECDICYKKLHDKSSLIRHKQVIHTDTPPMLSCEYCPERFSSVAKLARHVRTHAGDRPYPCKYCDKSFIKSHHYTRHLRLKHSEVRSPQDASRDEYRCEQCLEVFTAQDDLMYHSAIHATQNLTCPLCQEKFEDIDSVTTHIKSHVNGMEFMCDYCELVFTTKDKLDMHVISAHEEEAGLQVVQDEFSAEMEMEAEYDDKSINVKDEGDHMVVEIKKPNDYLISNALAEDRANNTNSEDSEAESGPENMPSLSQSPVTIKTLPPVVRPQEVVSEYVRPQEIVSEYVRPQEIASEAPAIATIPAPMATVTRVVATPPPLKTVNDRSSMAPVILQRAEEIKRKVVQPASDTSNIQEKKSKPESISGASDKSLRLLEKELQELQRTNTRNDASKTPAKPIEPIRGRGRPPMHTSTPKLRTTDEKKSQIAAKSAQIEKKILERRAIKENKKPDESKDSKTNNASIKEEKEVKSKESQEEKGKIVKKEEKSVLKNGSTSKSAPEEMVRRSSRPSKVKDYAKMVRDRTPENDDDDDDTDDDDDEYEAEKPEVRSKTRRSSVKVQPKVQPQVKTVTVTPARKRGRPRKGETPVPPKLKKAAPESDSEEKAEKMDAEENSTSSDKAEDQEDGNESADTSSSAKTEDKPNPVVAPSPHTLKKVPIKALPPGIKPLPLPLNARSMGTGELCEMQIGKKVVKVQKIVMTKAEVEAMAKKGLVEMKDGTMVLKQGIKIPTDPVAIKSTLVGEGVTKESPTKQEKAAPTRCELPNDM